MNPSTANPPVFGELDLSYPIQSQYVSRRDELYSSYLALDDSASQTLPVDRLVSTGQSYVSHLFDPSLAFHTGEPYNAEHFSETQVTPATPMGPPKSRKRKAPTLHADAWEPYKARIVELHITQGLPLREVKKTIERDFGFTAEYVTLFKIEKDRLIC